MPKHKEWQQWSYAEVRRTLVSQETGRGIGLASRSSRIRSNDASLEAFRRKRNTC